jgi:hypothetical protein
MSISVRRILSRLAAIAIATSAAPDADAAGPRDAGEVSDRDEPDLEDDRPIDREQLAPHDAAAELGRGLAPALARMRPMAATHLAAAWALSVDPVRRLAIANALEWPFRLVGHSIVIDHLARDPDPAIRAAVARAARSRWAGGGDPGVLARLAEDPDPEVRAVAAAGT